jgi:hypothetical protein
VWDKFVRNQKNMKEARPLSQPQCNWILEREPPIETYQLWFESQGKPEGQKKVEVSTTLHLGSMCPYTEGKNISLKQIVNKKQQLRNTFTKQPLGTPCLTCRQHVQSRIEEPIQIFQQFFDPQAARPVGDNHKFDSNPARVDYQVRCFQRSSRVNPFKSGWMQ